MNHYNLTRGRINLAHWWSTLASRTFVKKTILKYQPLGKGIFVMGELSNDMNVSGSDRPNPLYLNDSQCPQDTVHPIIGHICPEGHFCVAGSEYPEGKEMYDICPCDDEC